MDLTLSEEQLAVRELASRILTEMLPPEALRALEAAPLWFADDVWRALGQAGLLGIGLPEHHGGGGLGLIEVGLVAEQIGRTVAPVPYLSAVVGAGLTIARFGREDQQAAHLPGLAEGTHLLAAGFQEPHDLEVPSRPVTEASRRDGSWWINGEKSFVVGADRAAAVVVPARTGDACSTAFLVDPHAAGVTLIREHTVTGEPQWTMTLRGVEVEDGSVLGEVDGGEEVTTWATERMLAAICATQTGVCEEALAITARYVSTREQFGAKLGTFQAVGQRVADAYIDVEAIRLTALQAMWRLDAGLPAGDELLVAKFWSAEGAQRVVHTAQHLHGGIGVDLDYPIHRYFRWAKVLELTLGGATPSLRRLGAQLIA